jgi:hypothetical protein
MRSPILNDGRSPFNCTSCNSPINSSSKVNVVSTDGGAIFLTNSPNSPGNLPALFGSNLFLVYQLIRYILQFLMVQMATTDFSGTKLVSRISISRVLASFCLANILKNCLSSAFIFIYSFS